MKTINEWAKEIHENAVEHGWWDEPRSFAEVVALCHSELDCYRNDRLRDSYSGLVRLCRYRC